MTAHSFLLGILIISLMAIVAGGPRTVIRPQPGPQEQFLSTPADVAIYGGAAGGGKTWGLLVEPTRHIANPEFGAVFFRRTSPEITNQGGLWDEARRIYPLFKGTAYESNPKQYHFPSGAKIGFHHLQHEWSVRGWDGAQIPLILFDQLESFTAEHFWYLFGRNRSMCGVKPYIRATCNPDPDSFLASLLDWWIDQDSGYAVPERSGAIRWMVRDGNSIMWFATQQEGEAAARDRGMLDEDGNVVVPRSFTFIAASVFDNKILLKRDPGYLANLYSLTEVERERKLRGNWKIKRIAGNFFKLAWLAAEDRTIDDIPQGAARRWVRYWDLASSDTEQSDYTASCLMTRLSDGRFVVDHVTHLRGTPGERDAHACATLERDIQAKAIHGGIWQYHIEIVPGLGGEAVNAFRAMLVRHARKLGTLITITTDRVGKSKVDRAQPFANACEHGEVRFKRGAWNQELFDELMAFPSKGAHDDQVDACSGAFNKLALLPVSQQMAPDQRAKLSRFSNI